MQSRRCLSTISGGERVEWNKKLAAEYTESAMKIKGRLDELTAQINARIFV